MTITQLINAVKESRYTGFKKDLETLKYLQGMEKKGTKISNAPGSHLFKIQNRVNVSMWDVEVEDDE